MWLPVLFVLGMLVGSVISPKIPTEVLFEKLGISLVVLGWVLVLIPTSCPRCSRCFVLWNLPNWGYWLKIYFKNSFRPFAYVFAVFNSPCPHCGLDYQGDPKEPVQPQPQ